MVDESGPGDERYPLSPGVYQIGVALALGGMGPVTDYTVLGVHEN